MRRLLPALIFAAATAHAEPTLLGSSAASLLDYARSHNPDYAAMRLDADADAQRIEPAGALPDPKFRTELRDITRMGEQDPTVLPARVGSTRYLLMQDVPWLGKRDLKREIAEFDARGAEGRASSTWADLAARIKISYAQYQYVHRNGALTRELLDIATRLEKVAQVRYASGLAPQQDAIRAQIEQTGLRTELVALDSEDRQLRARVNALLARPAGAMLAEPAHARPLPAPANLDPATLDARLRTRNPQLFSDEAKLRAAEKGRDLAYKNRYPDFTLGISPIQYQGSVKEWELMVELNLPLQQGVRRAQEREAEAMLGAARARVDATTNQLTGELSAQLAALDAARRTDALVTTSLLPQAELTFQSAIAAYENGRVDFATLLDAQRQIREARQRRLKAQLEAQMSLAEIERLLGEDL